jgi:hypothetical protein
LVFALRSRYNWNVEPIKQKGAKDPREKTRSFFSYKGGSSAATF